MNPKRICIALVALVLVGCTPTRLEPPQLMLAGVSLTSGDLFSQLFRIRVHVHNPNDRALPVKGIEYTLFLEGDAFAEGTSTAPFVVPARGDQEFDMDVHTNFMSSLGRLTSRLETKGSNDVEYVFEGSVVIDATFSPKLRFSEKGTVKLPARR
jgi:LEA14-like dessication related protein